MGHFTKSPVYLDSSSLLNERQIRAINNTLKSQYNRMMSQGYQKVQSKPEIDTPYSSTTRLVDSLQCYSYNNLYWYSLTLDLKMSKAGEKHLLVRVPEIKVQSFTVHGIIGDSQLSKYGYITYEQNGNELPGLYITLVNDPNNVALVNVWIVGK